MASRIPVVDLALLVILIGFAANGAVMGLVRQLAGIGGLVAGLAAATILYRTLGRLLSRIGWHRPDPGVVAFLALFVGIWVLANLLAFRAKAHLKGRDAQDANEGWPDAAAGAVFGVGSGILMLCILVSGVVWLGLPVAEALQRSNLGAWFLLISAHLSGALGPWLPFGAR